MDKRFYRVAGITLVSAAALIAFWPRIVCVAFLGSWMGGRCVGQTNRFFRDEVLRNLDSIVTAELSYDAAYEGFIGCDTPNPRPVSALDKQAVAWVDSSCWHELGWRPDEQVRGTYWIEVSEDKTEFTAYAAVDIDHDGKPAYASTKSGRPAYDNPDEI